MHLFDGSKMQAPTPAPPPPTVTDPAVFTASRPVLAITGFLIVQCAAIGFWGGDLHRTVAGQGDRIDRMDRQDSEAIQRLQTAQEVERTVSATQYREIDHRLNSIEAKMDQLLVAASVTSSKGK